MLLAVCHSDGHGWSGVEDLDDISDLRRQAGKLLWAQADVSSLTEADVVTIQEEFGLHPLALEDALKKRERPKLEVFEEHHLFVVFHQLDEAEGQVEASQIASFIGEGFVLTLHDGADRTLDEVHRRWSQDAAEIHKGRTYLMHMMIDVVVDEYQSIADRLEDDIEAIEDHELASHEAANTRASMLEEEQAERTLYSIKQRTARLRRYALPTRRLVESIGAPGKNPFFSEQTLLLFRDIADHLERINDQIRNIDELTEAVLQLRRGEQSMSLNQINKKLTAWAAIIAAPTLISSIYGMNYELSPANQAWGFEWALSAMVATSALLYAFFRRKGWL
ncbi:MAG TPA: magnesium transporter CorA family protein [Actinomycetota bacterium]|nr:magnesium transporter CorA family protein [Actinomycetota bacterium]